MKELFIPVGLGVLMLSLGLALQVADFRRALLYPKAVIVALLCQAVAMPLACFLIVKLLGLGPELAVGMMLLAATPGGAIANLYSYLASGDVALNITITAINALLSLFTLPLLLGFSLQYFLGESKAIPLQTDKIIQVLTIIFVPVVIGMYLRHLRPGIAQILDRPMKILAALFLVAMTVFVIYTQWRELLQFFPLVGSAVIALSVISLVAGYCIALWVRLDRRQAIAISMEVGIHNSALAIALALSPLVLNNPTMAIPGTLYGILSLIVAAAFVAIVIRR